MTSRLRDAWGRRGPAVALGDGGQFSRASDAGRLPTRERAAGWTRASDDYSRLIRDADWDSAYLRERGLIPNVVNLIGDCSEATLLDAGTGTGWLFESVRPKIAYACDIVEPACLPDDVIFQKQNVHSLTYRDGMFDIIVASLLLMYCEGLPKVCHELRRVAKPRGSTLVVALTHPYFYRTGEVNEEGSFLVTKNLSRPDRFPFKIAEQVGPFEYFYRPFPDYLNAFIAAGWTISEIRDWFIDMNDYDNLRERSVMTRVKRSGQIPLFTFVRCTAA